MIIVTPFTGRKQSYLCECEQCAHCTGNVWRDLTAEQIYKVIKNPPPARIGEVTHIYEYKW